MPNVKNVQHRAPAFHLQLQAFSGSPRGACLLHLGRKDLLAPHLDALVRLLQTDDPAPRWVRTEQLFTPQAWTWGTSPGRPSFV